MKKILLLCIILVSAYSVIAQYSANPVESQITKNSRVASITIASGGFIENFSIYPNPVMDVLKVTFKSNRKSISEISLFNNIGKQVYMQESVVEPGNNIISIEIKNKMIDPGIYFMQFIAEKEVFTYKLVVK
ncbi:MAG: T9SS type A sorting domain-containing protein [Bacteroidota bacterium]